MEGQSSLNISLHPLVLINISEHYTRIKAQHGSNPVRVIGILLGVQSGRNVEIFNSFELDYELQMGKLILNRAFLTKRQELYKKTFPDYDLLGWYSSGASVTDDDIEIHKQFLDYNESPLYLLLNPDGKVPGATNSQSSVQDLPVAIYESEVKTVHETLTTVLTRCTYRIETGDSERIAVDHVARLVTHSTSDASHSLTQHLTGQHSAVNMLAQRIKILREYVAAVKTGQVPANHKILRQIASVAHRLPALDTPEFSQASLSEYNDSLLVMHLTAITNGICATNDLMDKFSLVHDKSRARFQAGF
eukprot:TRINITY_DN8401_c0_g1::TRINITY_DN8401_c0_g1_i1::g.29128::m.29128 TRINITY_DN8401_c0_g1::TRINITY_DN8401_c0_g1_i1::g.29128  ORF type:complete len:305 (+),score=37.70,sp/Q54C92/CSN6_DICDI/46.98/6e-84,MitMem_reg/PF13012.1/1.4e-22,JAB/PF01398.16/1.4e-18,DIPSY/PF11763.3/0.024,RepA_C/PF04796.7/0.16 TRINITY_DN8401_c0_g1_i1:55-969(+)